MNRKDISNFFGYKGALSRLGFLLFFIAIFLMLISFVKGIQILMFIPSFVLSIFLYSIIELYYINKTFSYHFYKDKNGNHLKMYLNNNSKYNFIIGNKIKNGSIEFLELNKDFSYTLKQDKEYNLILYVFGSFNIFRKRYEVGKLKLFGINNLHDFYLSERYSQGNELNKLDNLKSSLYNLPYVKKSYDLGYKNDYKLKIIANSNIDIISNKNLKLYHLFLIVLGTIGIIIEWANITLNIILLLTFIIIYLLKKKNYKIKKSYKNYLMIICFIGMIFLTFVNKDMSGPGSVFLIQILAILYLFPKDFKNSFLFIFLILFIFVAISLFSNQIRFIILFLIYIFVSIYLLFFISGTDSFDQKVYKFGTKIKKIKLFKTFGILTFFISLFFIILPHGNTVESNSTIGNNKNEGTISGFNEEISLENVQKIMEDSRKVIVIEDISKDDIYKLGLKYFRGMRSNYFDGKKWSQNFQSKRINFENKNIDTDFEELKMKYYLNGSKNIFLPATPISMDSNLSLYNKYDDNTIYKSVNGINEILTLDIKFKKDKSGKLIDELNNDIIFDNKVNKSMEKLFSFFIKKIPEEYKKSPQLISNFIREESGLTYSSQDIAIDINDFLYGKKQGHCEYFATTLAIVLQNYGYDATVVSGYSTGDYNNLASSYIVRAKNAHAWVEVYNKDTNTRIILDPTPGDYSNNKSDNKAFAEAIIKLYDYIDIKWYTYVVNYTGKEQKKLYSYIFSNKSSIFYSIFSIIILYIIITLINNFIKFLKLSKKEKILFILSKKYKKPNNIIKYIYSKDEKFSKKLENYIYGDKGEISYKEIYRFIFK